MDTMIPEFQGMYIPEFLRSRKNDPVTSKEAARIDAAKHFEAIMSVIRQFPFGIGASRIADKTGLTQVQICRRLPELQKLGMIEVGNKTELTKSGRNERTWRIK